MRKLFSMLNVLLIPVLLTACLDEDTDDLVDDRDAFLGAWNVTESCSKDSYSVQITKDPSNSAQVLINNFWNTGNCGNAPYAIVAGSSLYLPQQDFCNGDLNVEGSGEMIKEKVNWSYSVNDGADLHNCSATYVRP